MLGEDELRRVAGRVLTASRADQTEVAVFSHASALTRFANNYIHQNVQESDVSVRVRAVLEGDTRVARFELAPPAQGGDGVTMVAFSA